MKQIKTVLIVISVLFSSVNISIADNYDIDVSIELTEESINAFINEQYNRAGFQRVISGSGAGITYEITLYVPKIKLFDNSAKVIYGFKIESNIFNDYVEFIDDVSFDIPSIENMNVTAVSEGFVDKVNSLDIPEDLKDAIIAAWVSLELEAYPKNLAKEINNSEWLAQRRINVTDFLINFRSVNKKLLIDLVTEIDAQPPHFAARWLNESPAKVQVKAYSKIRAKKIEFYIITGSADKTIYPNTWINKDAYSTYSLGKSYAEGTKFIRILYENDNTFYLRTYKCSMSGLWGTLGKSIN